MAEQWSYYCLEAPSGSLQTIDLANVLNALGSEGWNFAATIEVQGGSVLILKRLHSGVVLPNGREPRTFWSKIKPTRINRPGFPEQGQARDIEGK